MIPSMLDVKRLTIAAIVVVSLGLLVVKSCQYGRRSVTAKQPVAIVLPSEDKEQIVISPAKHSITIKTPSREETLFLPDRSSTIDIKKDGRVTVTAKQFGLEHTLFVGVGMSNNVLVSAGLDFFYFKRLDLGAGLASDFNSARALGCVSYTIYNNTRLSLGYDTKQHLSMSLTVRL